MSTATETAAPPGKPTLGPPPGRSATDEPHADASSPGALASYLKPVGATTTVALALGVLLAWISGGGLLASGWAFSSFAAGTLLGFLFGIPKTVGDGSDVNTNLEDVSDWLSKIIIGATLVHLERVFAFYNTAAGTFASAFPAAEFDYWFNFAQWLMGYFAVAGFLAGWVLTRLFLAPATRIADRAHVKKLVQRLESMQQEIDAVMERAEMHPDDDPPPPGD